MNNTKGRIKWLDFGKGFTIFCVVLFHALAFRRNVGVYILGTFIMPVFFAISGYLYKPTNTIYKYLVMLYKKITSIFLPYILMDIFIWIIWIFLSHPTLNINNVISSPVGHLWFLIVLFIIFIFVSSLVLCKLPIFIQLFLFIIIFLLMPFSQFIPKYSLGIHLFEGYLICFYIGYLIKFFNFIKYIKKIKYGVPLLFIWIISMIYSYKFIGSKDVDSFHSYDIVIKFLSILAFFFIFEKVDTSKGISKYFIKYGKYTLIIYLIHLPLMIIFRHFLLLITNNYLLDTFILTIVIWFSSLLVCKISTKLNIVDFIFYPRAYINKFLAKFAFWEKFINNN